LKGAEHLRGRPMAEITAAPPVVAEIKRAVARVNAQLAPFEQIRRYRVLDRDLTIQAGELTATMKIRRNRVLSNHRPAIEELYSGRESL
jgi:long-chain acyl-CoA synthetase